MHAHLNEPYSTGFTSKRTDTSCPNPCSHGYWKCANYVTVLIFYFDTVNIWYVFTVFTLWPVSSFLFLMFT